MSLLQNPISSDFELIMQSHDGISGKSMAFLNKSKKHNNICKRVLTCTTIGKMTSMSSGDDQNSRVLLEILRNDGYISSVGHASQNLNTWIKTQTRNLLCRRL